MMKVTNDIDKFYSEEQLKSERRKCRQRREKDRKLFRTFVWMTIGTATLGPLLMWLMTRSLYIGQGPLPHEDAVAIFGMAMVFGLFSVLAFSLLFGLSVSSKKEYSRGDKSKVRDQGEGRQSQRGGSVSTRG